MTLHLEKWQSFPSVQTAHTETGLWTKWGRNWLPTLSRPQAFTSKVMATSIESFIAGMRKQLSATESNCQLHVYHRYFSPCLPKDADLLRKSFQRHILLPLSLLLSPWNTNKCQHFSEASHPLHVEESLQVPFALLCSTALPWMYLPCQLLSSTWWLSHILKEMILQPCLQSKLQWREQALSSWEEPDTF